MDEPTFDRDGYPTQATLDEISHWPFKRGLRRWLEFAAAAWDDTMGSFGPARSRLPKRWREDEEETWAAITGGWSGNEDVVAAMRENWILWSMIWRVSVAGGYYEFGVDRGSHDSVS